MAEDTARHNRGDSRAGSAAADLCESPIEEKLLGALRASLEVAEADLGLEIEITPQLRVGRYRLDFGVVACRGGLEVNVAVECDGREFHSEREDRERDRNRDHDIAEFGWSTMRFTGATIHRQPLGCAWEVFTFASHQLTLMRRAAAKRAPKRSVEAQIAALQQAVQEGL